MRRSARAIAALMTAFLLGPASTPVRSASELGVGKLLIAREDMHDPNFERTVVLLVAYGDSGAMGVVLNRPSHMRLDHLLPHLRDAGGLGEQVFLGGPVAVRQATILFTSKEAEGRMHVFGDVHVTGELALLERLVTDPRPNEKYRVYAGHAGWAPGQLDAEVLRLGWHVRPATEAMVFGETGDLWRTLIKRTQTRLARAQQSDRGLRPGR